MALPNSNTDDEMVADKNLPSYLKICLFTVAASFLAFSIYWAVRIPFSLYDIIVFFSSSIFQNSPMSQPLSFILIVFQEFAVQIGLFFNLVAAILVFQGTFFYMKKDKKWLEILGKSLIFEAIFFFFFIPTSIHHLLGAILSMVGADIFAGLSYLLQVLLIAPSFIMLGYNLKRSKNYASIRKWLSIAAPLFVFGFWFKYLFFWMYALSPLGLQEATLMSAVGATNSFLTLLIAGILAAFACLDYYGNRKVNKWLVGFAIILFGGYFIIYDLVSIWVPVYASFLYLTDFWMITLSIMGAAILKINNSN